MLYRTHHHPFFFTFNPFSNSSLSAHRLSPLSPSLQVMECAQGAPRSGFGSEKASMDETWCVSAATAANRVSVEDLFVEEFLDFSHVFPDAEEQPQKLEEPEEKEHGGEKGSSVSNEKQRPPEFGYLPESVETVFTAPAEGLESLEWLSHFVEESFSDYPLTGKLPPNSTEKKVEPAAGEKPSFISSVQTKARTKRARTGIRVWPVLSSSFTESTTSSSSSSSSTTSFSPLSPSQTIESYLGKPLFKRKKKKSSEATGYAASGAIAAVGQPRRCSHCGVTKTPQWRAGPLGSKTLCNACGVRFKSGRLLPEYRPACSPTFSSEMHSNNHRKVLEMRRKKEADIEPSGRPHRFPVFEDQFGLAVGKEKTKPNDCVLDPVLCCDCEP